jgi:hypothetical protein
LGPHYDSDARLKDQCGGDAARNIVNELRVNGKNNGPQVFCVADVEAARKEALANGHGRSAAVVNGRR